SVESMNRDYFRIGFFATELSKNNKKNSYFFLMTFTEKDDLPVLSKTIYINNRTEVEFIMGEKGIEYRHEPLKDIDFSPGGIKGIIKNWEANTGKKELKPLKAPPFYEKSRIFAPIQYWSMFLSLAEESNKSLPEIPLFFPDKSVFSGPFVWIAPIRSKPRRTYDRFKQTFSPEGEHSPYLIKRLLTDKKDRDPFLKFIKDFGSESNLLNSIEINPFGNDPSSPFELMVRLNETLLNINYVGYGISQCLPLLVEMFSQDKDSWFAIQQPEVHLHPKAQAALGTLIYNLAVSQNKNFLIETHSDYIIDRFRLNRRRNAEDKIASQVLYFERTQQGNSIYPIDIDESGNYSQNQPKSFRDFFIKEQMDLQIIAHRQF
ncbi:MAG TPA: AAA family ATPase, partial [Candidatus Deferrimicrobium sp.]|nr:AAA family ATPase [Candidatus Deferrimicrobium sp.]